MKTAQEGCELVLISSEQFSSHQYEQSEQQMDRSHANLSPSNDSNFEMFDSSTTFTPLNTQPLDLAAATKNMHFCHSGSWLSVLVIMILHIDLHYYRIDITYGPLSPLPRIQ